MAPRRERANSSGEVSGSATPAEGAFRIFISYAHVDEPFKDALDKHLSPLLLLGRAESWHDRHIQAGARLYEKIQSNIENAHIVLMIVSADYLASTACQGEMTAALQKSDDGTAVAIPIIVRACNWTILPIGNLLAANQDGTPINSQVDPDVAWTQVARKIGDIVTDWQVRRPIEESSQGQVPVSLAAEEEQSLDADAAQTSGERWVYRRDDNDDEWEKAKAELAEALVRYANGDADAQVELNVRPWGDKVIVDFTLPQYRNSRRLLIRDIGGYVGYPGYQLEMYASDDRVKIEPARVRWLSLGDGSRVLRKLPGGGDATVLEFAHALWREIAGLARSGARLPAGSSAD